MIINEGYKMKEKITVFTTTKEREKVRKKLCKKYELGNIYFRTNSFTFSVLSYFNKYGKITKKQLQALKNINEAHVDYLQDKKNRAYGSSYSGSEDEGYWDDLGSMGYLY